jgi:predicted lipoprotein with Yx(FWY)xxD motif
MKRHHTLLAGALAAALLAVAGIASAAAKPIRAHEATGATVALRETSLGMILVNSAGFTLYEFSKDKKNSDTCVTISGCDEVWPLLETSGAPIAGEGVNAKKLSTITVPGGGSQVTYYGHPLYTYVGDKGPGETSYVGAKEFGGTWYALTAKAKKVKQPSKGGGW